MKRAATSNSSGDHDARPAKAQRRTSSGTWPGSPKKESEPCKSQQPIQPFLPGSGIINPGNLEHQAAALPSPTNESSERIDEIFQWIPAPSEVDEPDTMSQPALKRQRSQSLSNSRGRMQSFGSDNESSSGWVAKTSAYQDINYPTVLETKGCFMDQDLSSEGPIPEDIAFCKRLLNRQTEVPDGTMLDNRYIKDFYRMLAKRSEARLLVDLHPLFMPSAEIQCARGRPWLKNVIDEYNESWMKTDPIYGPRPQPDHARGLKNSTFSESQVRKLGIKPDDRSPYTAREEMYFPYLTAEIKKGDAGLEIADRQNMHSMCIALRGVVILAQAAGCLETVNRRILGFSISHELKSIRIYGYYPEIINNRITYHRQSIANHIDIWTEEGKWTCYHFVENLDREFLPLHTDRLMRFLERIPDPEERSLLGVDADSQLPKIASQKDGPWAIPSPNQIVQSDSRTLMLTFNQHLEDQKVQLLGEMERQRLEQGAKHREQEEKKEAEHKAEVGRLLAELREQSRAQLEERRLRDEKQEKKEAEQREREEKKEADQREKEAEHKAEVGRLLAELREQSRAQLEERRLRDEKQEKKEAEQREREEKKEAEHKAEVGRILSLLESRK